MNGPEPRAAALNVTSLSICQALLQSALIVNLIAAGFVGLDLASDKSLSTLPIALLVVTSTATTIPAALVMRRYGRRAGFLLGAAIGVVAGLLAAQAILARSFELFLAAGVLLGMFQGFAQFYRFAAAESAPPAWRSRAIAWVIAGGVLAAVAGPALARWTRNAGAAPFVSTYHAIAGLALVSIILLALTRLPRAGAASADAAPARPLGEVARQPAFVAALAGSAAGFAVMSLVMTATPLAMAGCGFGFPAAADVIQWHVLGMFLPSFFTGSLIRRYGAPRIMAAGLALFAAQFAVALSGTALAHFTVALILLGMGWNFLFVGGSALLVDTYRPAEKEKAQALHDVSVFGLAGLATLGAGGLLYRYGWLAVNLATLPLMAVAAVALFRLRRADRPAAHPLESRP